VAGSRLFVQRGRFDEVVDGVAAIAKSIKMGPGMEPGTQMGPLVSEEQLRLVTGYLKSGEDEGATALAGGGRHGDRGYFVEPTVLTNTRPDMKVCQRRDEVSSSHAATNCQLPSKICQSAVPSAVKHRRRTGKSKEGKRNPRLRVVMLVKPHARPAKSWHCCVFPLFFLSFVCLLFSFFWRAFASV
jgi:hypothetical protein